MQMLVGAGENVGAGEQRDVDAGEQRDVGGEERICHSPLVDVRKLHIVCLNSWDVAYISVEQFYLVSINFKMKSNMIKVISSFTPRR